jgi:hypothetical protein
MILWHVNDVLMHYTLKTIYIMMQKVSHPNLQPHHDEVPQENYVVGMSIVKGMNEMCNNII